MKNFFKLLVITVILFISFGFLNYCYAQNPVSGHVLYSDNYQPVSGGTVNAYNMADYSLLATTNINSDGSYYFQWLPGENIDVIGIPPCEPEGDGFMPAYHPNKMDWQSAVPIFPSVPLYDVNIYVTRIKGGGGNSFTSQISGTVKMNNAPFANAIVLAKQGDDYKGWGITNANGEYKIKGLPVGDYILICQRIGTTTATQNVKLTNDGLKDISFNLEYAKKAETVTVDKFTVSQNYPNPFNPTTKIDFSIPKDGTVKLAVYSLTGQLVKEIMNEYKTAGSYTASFDGTNVASGVYFYTISFGDFTQTKKMSLIK